MCHCVARVACTRRKKRLKQTVMANEVRDIQQHPQQGEIILYQPDETVRIEVRLEDDTVWLTQAQMAELFQTTRNNVTLHIGNIFKEQELEAEATSKESLQVQTEGNRQVTRQRKLYNLDVIISVGYRVKSQRGTKFRQWANKVIKEYLLRGYAINQQLMQMEQRLDARIEAHVIKEEQHFQQLESTLADHQQKLDFFVQTSLPPVVGVFSGGQVFSARLFVENLIKAAKCEVVLIDSYIDAQTFDLLDVRAKGVSATIYTKRVDTSLQRLQTLHNQEHPTAPVTLQAFNRPFHDRFLIIDDELWHCGASFKDLGRKLFAIDKMCIDKNIILNQL